MAWHVHEHEIQRGGGWVLNRTNMSMLVAEHEHQLWHGRRECLPLMMAVAEGLSMNVVVAEHEHDCVLRLIIAWA